MKNKKKRKKGSSSSDKNNKEDGGGWDTACTCCCCCRLTWRRIVLVCLVLFVVTYEYRNAATIIRMMMMTNRTAIVVLGGGGGTTTEPTSSSTNVTTTNNNNQLMTMLPKNTTTTTELSECSCWNNLNAAAAKTPTSSCCIRRIYRAHKMGWVMSTESLWNFQHNPALQSKIANFFQSIRGDGSYATRSGPITPIGTSNPRRRRGSGTFLSSATLSMPSYRDTSTTGRATSVGRICTADTDAAEALRWTASIGCPTSRKSTAPFDKPTWMTMSIKKTEERGRSQQQ